MHEQGFQALGMLGRRPDPGAARGAHNHGNFGFAAEHVFHLGLPDYRAGPGPRR